MVTPALAQGGPDLGLEFATETGLTTTDVRTTISRIIRSFLGFLGIVAVMIILYAGFLWMTAGGNEEQVSKAKKMMVNGVIGLVIILSAFTIVTFLFRAITGESTAGTDGGPGGGPGFGGGGGPGSFYVESITPYGPGPSSGGWPKNYSITATLSRPPAPDTIDTSSVIVKQCNPRIDSETGESLDFDFSACGTAVPLKAPPLVEGRKIIVKPQWPDPPVPEEDPTDYEGEFWYRIELVGGFISDSDVIDTLYCPDPAVVLEADEDESSLSAPKDLCIRAVAMNDMRDVEAPTVRLNTPKSPPGFCSSTITIDARATDDFLPARIEFQLEDELTGIFYDVFEDDADPPQTDGVSTNSEQVNPYYSREILINTFTLPPGKAYTLTAVAFDPVPRSSENVARQVIVSPAHCCNGVNDPPETGIDCGDGPLPTMCGMCEGDYCDEDGDCTSGYCDLLTNTCIEQPIIDDISVAEDASNPPDHLMGGVGTPVVITGRFFTNRGGVIFMGTDDDGDDDVQAELCAPDAWRYLPLEKKYEVTVTVPEGAASGPIRLVTSDGQFDDTTDEGEFMTAPNEFDVDGPVLPGVCYLSPNTGPAGTETTIHGSGFGGYTPSATVPTAEFGENPLTLVDVENNWKDGSMVARVPAVRDGVYPVTVTIGSITTAPVSFSLVPPAGYESPTITEILPSSGPIDSYVTIVGSGFGVRKGTVKFFIGDAATPDIALAGEPVCDQNWFKNYIIVKVPQNYQTGEVGTGIGDFVRDGIHRVQVETASPSDTSNFIDFTVDNDLVLKPGMCSITPDNGPPALPVYVSGEGFGADQAADGSDTVDFYMDGQITMSSENYPDWDDGKVTAYVPGLPGDRSTWPRTGPVYLKNANLFSSNGIPYLVQNCNDPGASCEIGTSCCENGVCDAGTWTGETQTRAACEPLSRDSSYGWKFSTDTLPSVPQVVERSSCAGGAFKSPSPYKQSEDACINAKLQVQFNRLMDVPSLNAPGAVKVEMCKSGTCSGDGVTSCYENSDCGQENGTCGGAEPRCEICDEDGVCTASAATTTVPTYIDTTDGSLDPQDSSYGMYMFISRIGDVVWDKNKWYKVTFVSRLPSEDGLTSGFGVQERLTLRYLDGDFDKSLGGNYEYFFKTRDSDLACELSKVTVIPPDFTIDHLMGDSSAPGHPDDGFRAILGAANCNTLNCFAGPTPQYNIAWDTDTDFLEPDPFLPTSGACIELLEVRALQETEFVIVEASGVARVFDDDTGDEIVSSAVPKIGESDVRIKFADPYVKEYAPNCTEACVNGSIWAKFNVMMQTDTLNSSTVDVIKCRNASCNPPFITLEQPTGLSFFAHGNTDTLFDGSPSSEGFLISLPALQTFDPASYYLVKVKGGDEGVKSGSGVNLTGMNDEDGLGEYFSWTFRTKDDGSPCAVNRVAVSPEEVTLNYVGERQAFSGLPYGEPDACDPNGQILSPLSYDWEWKRDEADDSPVPLPEDSVVAGFIDPTKWTAPIQISDGFELNSNPIPFAGCTNSCLLQGSQAATSQCGNGIDEPGEQCERRGGFWDDYCDDQTCLWTGTPDPLCGNGSIDDGETCDKIEGEFPPGCIQPTATNGCLHLGSSGVSGSICGNGALEDGEDCDDGNSTNWDGCSGDCLAHGSLPSCEEVDEDGEGNKGDCVSFCGNGIPEDGEDANCDLVVGVVADGCDRITCLREGSNTCSDPVMEDGCCGNWTTEPSAGEECDPGPDGASWCSSSCLLVGSSYLHDDPSFCGDGYLGLGESLQCDGNSTDIAGVDTGVLPNITPDANIDHYQVIVTGSYSGEGGAQSHVYAGVSDLPAEDVAEATVNLSCVCDAQDDPQEYCSQFPVEGLGCDSNGCCADAPDIIPTPYPPRGSTGICRNTGVRIRFDQDIDALSADAVSLWAEKDGSCEESGEQVMIERSWFGNLIHKALSFIKTLFGSWVNAEEGDTECTVDYSVSVSGPTVRLAPTNALEANQDYVIKLTGGTDGLKGSGGVPLEGDDAIRFTTGDDICVIESVSIEPSSHLFTVAADLGSDGAADEQDGDHEFTAIAIPSGGADIPGAEIVSTPEYGFKWNWRLQLESSVIVVDPTDAPLDYHNGFCEEGQTINPEPEPGEVDECNVDTSGEEGGLDLGGCGNSICEANTGEYDDCEADCAMTPGHELTADVIVRNEEHDLVDGNDDGVFPMNGEAIVYVAAEISQSSKNNSIEASADVVTMLCDNPWPARKKCPSNGEVDLPWDHSPVDADGEPLTCIPGQPIWYPFYDPATNVSFFYCRDEGSGDSHDGTLPALSETIVEIGHPAPAAGEDGILTEYLFTYTDSSGAWGKDAIGIRFATNQNHRLVQDWYDESGFIGAPAPTEIGGYPALQGSRTAYVNAAAYVPGSGTYTNVNILSYSDGAAPETVAIYSQILKNIDFNRLVKDSNFCVDSAGDPVLEDDKPIGCSADIDCRFDAEGAPITDSETWTCRSPKSKMQRDVTRIGDLLAARDDLLQIPEGAYPKLLSGTFLTTRTNSAWSSWDGVLSEESATLLPKDPVNDYAVCGEGYDQETCWNSDDQLYLCPSGSHVYDYSGRGGLGFVLSGALELSNCSGLSETICTEMPGCEYVEEAAGGGGVGVKPEYCPPNQTTAACILTWPQYTTYYGDTFQTWVGLADYFCGGSPSCDYTESNYWCATRTYNGYPYACPYYYNDGGEGGSTGCRPVSNTSWKGNTCMDKGTSGECGTPQTTGCFWENGNCEFDEGQIHLEGMPGYAGSVCSGVPQGTTTICGDGVRSSTEQCEPGEFYTSSCTAANGRTNGQRTRLCSELCIWEPDYVKDESGTVICDAGYCGDGVIQSEPNANETCDDGSALNGTYGYCGLSCNTAADYCGDGIRQPSEACDCYDKNGSYEFNGITAQLNQYGPGHPVCGSAASSANTASCAWDCQGAGPRCGDGIINGPYEACDGGFEEFKGWCSDTSGLPDPESTGCNQNEDCPVSYTCGNFCPTVEQKNTRGCRPNDPTSSTPAPGDATAACTWTDWECTLPGVCGNGIVETGEQCDDLEIDGPLGDAGECVMHQGVSECVLNVCGDGYINAAGDEECDEGGNNGQPCIPNYDSQCTFCTAQCKAQSVSGGFCGNGLLENSADQPPGPEECDGATGFSGNWICVSQRDEHGSYGVNTGDAICSAEECRIECTDAQSNPCKNDLTLANFDAGSPEDIKPAFGDQDWFPEDYFFSVLGTQTELVDACDPDKDADGVPQASRAECDDNNPDIHGAYYLEYNPSNYITGEIVVDDARFISIDEIPEICNLIDDNCSGEVDEGWMKVGGNMVYGCSAGAANVGAQGVRVRAYCGDTLSGSALASTRTDSSGRYDMDVFILDCAEDDIYVYANTDGTTNSCYEMIQPTGAVIDKLDNCTLSDGVNFIVGRDVNVDVTIKTIKTGQAVSTNEGRVRARVQGESSWSYGDTNSSGVARATIISAPDCVIEYQNVQADSTCRDSSKDGTMTGSSSSCSPSTVTATMDEVAWRPAPGDITTWVGWGNDTDDYDYHMTGGGCLGYECTSGTCGGSVWGCSTEATLDRDWTDGPGPETITLDGSVAGRTYNFYLHLYSGSNWPNMTFHRVGNNCVEYTRSRTSGSGEWWHIGRFLNGTYTNVNSMSNSDPTW